MARPSVHATLTPLGSTGLWSCRDPNGDESEASPLGVVARGGGQLVLNNTWLLNTSRFSTWYVQPSRTHSDTTTLTVT